MVYKKDFHFSIEGNVYIIKNVPYMKADYDDEELYDVDTTIKLTAIRDLMYENEMPHIIDFDNFADVEF